MRGIVLHLVGMLVKGSYRRSESSIVFGGPKSYNDHRGSANENVTRRLHCLLCLTALSRFRLIWFHDPDKNASSEFYKSIPWIPRQSRPKSDSLSRQARPQSPVVCRRWPPFAETHLQFIVRQLDSRQKELSNNRQFISNFHRTIRRQIDRSIAQDDLGCLIFTREE